jgi:rhodanese-related sulfurtransferase
MQTINAPELKQKLDAGEAILIDVREADEYAREHIIGAHLAPLSAIGAHDFGRDHGKAAVFHCRSGMRTQANATKLLAQGFREAYCLDGGIEAWKSAGFPVHANRKAPLEIMRQVQIAAGLLILTGVILGAAVHPAFYALSAFVGAGLTFAGATGWCGTAMLLKTMPWNRGTLSA